MYSQEELDHFYNNAPSVSDEQSGLARFGEHLANFPSNFIQSFADTGTSIAKIVAGPTEIPSVPIPKPFDVGEIGSTGHPIIDVVAGHLLPELAASLVPFAGVSRAAKAVGAGELAADILGNAAAGAFTGIKSGPEEGIHQAVINAALAGLGPLGVVKKAIPALGLAGADALYDYAQHQNTGQAAEAGALDLGFAFLPNVAHSILNRIKNPHEAIIPDEIILPNRNRRALRLEDQNVGQGIAPEYQERLGLPAPDQPVTSFQGYEGSGPVIFSPSPYGGELPGYYRGNLPVGTNLLPEGTNPIELGPIQPTNQFRENLQIEGPQSLLPPHLQESLSFGDIQLPQVEPYKDDFFRLLEPPRAPEDFITSTHDIHPVEEISNKQPSLNQNKPEPEPEPVEVAKPETHSESISQPVVESQPKPQEQTQVIRVRTPRGAVDAQVNSFSDGIYHVTIDDPVHGPRNASIPEFDLEGQRQVFPKIESPALPEGGVPFKDIKLSQERDPSALHEEVKGREENISVEELARREEANQKLGMKRRVRPGEYGFISTHAAFTVAGAGIGAEEGYRQSGGDPQKALAGAVIGAGVGLIGYKAIEALTRINPRLSVSGKLPEDLKGFKREVAGSAESVMSKTARDLAGEDVRGDGGIMSKFMKGMEFWGRFHLPESVKSAWTQAHGAGVLAVSQVTNALESLKGFKPDANIVEAASKFLEGKFLPEAEATRLILKGGGVSDEAWKLLDPKSRSSTFTRWETSDGKVWWMPEVTKQNLIAEEENAFKSLLGKDNAQYYNFVRVARRSLDNLQNLFSEGLPDGSLKKLIQNSTGQYVTRSYKIFNDPQYRPTEAQIQAAMQELGDHLTSEGVDFNKDSLRLQIESYLSDLKQNKQSLGFVGGKSKIDSTLLKEREDISPTFRELLGEYTDPKEKILASINRLYPSAQASRFISMASKMEIDGLPASLNHDEWLGLSNKFHDIVDNLKGRPILSSTQQTVLADAETKIKRLNEYVKIEKNLKFGEFSGVLSNRFIADQLKGIDPHMAGLDHPIFRGMAKFNTVAKLAHTAYDHIRVVRNIITVPMFAWIGKASYESMGQALEAIKSKKGPLYQELIENGILGADQVTAEFRGGLYTVLNGHYDSGLTQWARGVHNKVLDFYRIPDAVTRAGAYIEAKSRYSAELKLPIDHPEVLRKAVEWTDRRTMNYENVAPFVRVARNIPFFNLYISYASEMARIVKNLSLDAVGKGPTGKADLQALAQLGILAGAFEGIQAGAEAMLSPKDREDWKHANNQSPDYSRSRYRIPYNRDKNGSFNYIDLTPLVVTDSFNQTFRSLAKGDIEAAKVANPVIGWDNSPVFSILNQLNTGTDRNTRLALRTYQDKAQVIAREISPSWVPGIGYQWHKAATIGTQNIRTGREETWPKTIASNLIGLNLSSVNPAATEAGAQSQLKQAIADERAYLNSILKMKGISREKQDRAVQQYQNAVQAAIANYITERNR